MSVKIRSDLKQAEDVVPVVRPRKLIWKQIVKRADLYLMLLLPIAWYIIFQYGPMYGLQIAFKTYVPTKGFWGSPFVGFQQFQRFFSAYYFWQLIRNTVSISVLSVIFGFPIPVFLALLINEIKSNKFKKFIQNVTYMPHFISLVVIVGMLNLFLDPQNGVVNTILHSFGMKPIAFMTQASWFKPLFVGSNIWQDMGWQSIIYIAALSGVDPQLYEAAQLDGATRMQRIWHVSIPAILPVVIILLILDVGRFMNVGFEKILLMQNALNMSSSNVIPTFTYTTGILNGEYGYTTAIGLFNNLINFVLLVFVNRFARKRSETSLW